MSLVCRLFLPILIISSFGTVAWSQAASTSLRGTVTDSKGAVLPGADLMLADSQTGISRSTKTNNIGAYQFLHLPPGDYSITVAAKGFATIKQDSVRLLVDTPATINFTVEVRSETTTIHVQAEAGLVNTQDATLGHAFDARQIDNLPFEGRNPVAILSLQPGVAFIGNNESINPDADSRNGAVNGGRSDQANITIDGVDDNDQTEGYAFQGALRATLDSIQEFRVTTSNANADAGRSSGAQVALVTKSGTNKFHGSLYEYNRADFTSANDWFNKQAEILSGLPNRPGELIRNTFGTSIGGPIKNNRLFFFATYEGQRTRENSQITRIVPSASLRQGIIQYQTCPTAPNCIAGDPGNTNVSLNPSQIATMDPNCTALGTCPLGSGVNPAVMKVLQTYPLPNAFQVGDGLNYQGYTFSAPAPGKLDTYIVKLDYNITQNGNHRVFLRGNLQNDHLSGTGDTDGAQFPGDPPNHADLNNSKGIAGGYTAVVRNNLVNSFDYGYIRQGTSVTGLSDQHHVILFGLDDPLSFSRATSVQVPAHNFVDDVSWIKGKHTIQFGANFRMVDDLRNSNQNSFFDAQTNVAFLANSGLANKGASLDPAKFGFPAVASFFESSYDIPMTTLAGIIAEVDAIYNRTKTGTVLPEGTPIARHFRDHEAEWYVQDSWRINSNFVVTGGLRYTLLQPPYETSGTQVAPSVSLNNWFRERWVNMLQGKADNPPFSFGLSGQANDGKPYWDWDYKDLAPRLAFAWSPRFENSWLKRMFGDSGKSSIRGGYGMYYDHFGQGVVNTFDRYGSFGLSTLLTNPAGNVTVDTAPRFTTLYDIPTSSPAGPVMVIPPPQGGFPVTPPTSFEAGGYGIGWGLDDKMKTPYSHLVDFSITRELPHNFIFSASYVGRFAHRLLQQEDLAMPLDLIDPVSGTDYFSAASQLSRMAVAGTAVNAVGNIPYWQDIFPSAAGPAATQLAGCGAPGESALSTVTATQAMYDSYYCNLHNEVVALQNADVFCFPACATIRGVTQPYQFFSGQFATLYAWRSIGNSAYNAAQLSLQHHMTHGLQMDVNYTLSKSIDVSSNAERVNFNSYFSYASQIINSWDPKQLRGPSDFDALHQINSNWVYELPIGRGQRWGSTMGGFSEALLGGWQFSGLFRWTSGFPYSIGNGFFFPTNWDLEGAAVLTGKVPESGTFRDSNGNPNIFKNINAALASFRFAYPGESGNRNEVRGAGFFGIDTGLSKTWKLAESQSLRFSWETFNITNSVRFGFDLSNGGGLPSLGTTGTFGEYNQTLTKPRVMQFALRYGF
jgi:hypothetical protein